MTVQGKRARAEMIDLRDLRPERVCLIKPSALGDIVHALPTLSALRARWPEARISRGCSAPGS